jgi:enoyl-CoA hydratase/carnithine racemase
MLGGAPGIGGVSRLTRLIGRTATAEMVLTGLPVSARRMHQLGGVNEVVPNGQSLPRALEFAAHMAAAPPHALAGVKQMLAKSDELLLGAGLANDASVGGRLFARDDSCQIMRDVQDRFDAGETFDDVYWRGADQLRKDRA